MNIRVVAWCILSLSLLPAVQAQDFKRQYKNARDLFNAQRYNLALEAFKPLTVYDKENIYIEYASFYYALSAYHLNYLAVAKDMLLQIRQLYPSWNKMPEVNLWLAKLYFDQREYFQGLHVLSAVQDSVMAADIAAMKQHYLAQVSDVETLKMMLEEHPNDVVLARTLVATIGRQPYDPQQQLLFDSLISAFSLDRQEFQSPVPQNIQKERYKVGLLFPFLASTLEPTPAPKRSQAILELYQGMKLANDTLAAQDILIDLQAYDTERNNETLQNLLAAEELRQVDLLVGPLFQEEVKAVQAFSKEHKINMINPVSNNSEFVGDNPFAMLFQPSYETIGKRAAELIAGRVKNKNCIVYFGDAPRDSVLAFSFMQRAQEVGLNIVLAEEHRKETAARIISTLATATEFDEFRNPTQFTLKKDSIGSIFVASDNGLIYSKVINSVETRADSVLIVGAESWIAGENATLNFEQFERLRGLLAAPNYTAFSNPEFQVFRRRYLLRHGQQPTTFARLGYEFMLCIGKALWQHGVYFQQGLVAQGFFAGTLGEGYQFTTRDNQHVPFVMFRQGVLTPVPSAFH